MQADEVTPEAKPRGNQVPFTTAHMPQGLKLRRLKLDTLSKHGYFVHKDNGKSLHIANYYDQQGRLAYQKYRDAEKNFWFVPMQDNPPRIWECQLFGQQVWGDKYDKKVVVIEGEIDEMTVAQATGMKMAVVSIPAGVGSAIKSVKANYRWLDRFEEVIFWMDNDEPGQSVIDELCSLFPGKAKTIKVEGFKDASEMAQADREGDIYGAVWSATLYSPEGIVNAALCADDMDEPEGEMIAEYPWPVVQENTKGIREGEVCYHVAGTGIGKTSQIVEVQDLLLRNGVKFGVMRFEDTRRKAQLDLMSLRAGRRLHLDPLPKDEMRTLHTAVFGSGQVELFDPEKAKWDFESIQGYLRYMVMALGCKVVFIDPLSFIVAGTNERDERKALDKVAYEFAQFVKHTKANLQIAHHLTRPEGKAHEEGAEISVNQIRGSGGIANFSMLIFGYERNQQGERPDLTRIRVLKCRWTGWTGIADTLRWDPQLGRQIVTDETYPDSKGEASGGGFGMIEKEY
ncbi:toprim domain-containing protein [Agrobacterium sp. CFBP2214]|uniref:toprim domain-containing protein n=1 Tax=Agrobacterium sp. CFBP2214 TaxID=3040274 RepID=UPI0013AFE0F8|nr:toprim domain-containing protein [Agrobacterium sp. CFBP2214]